MQPGKTPNSMKLESSTNSEKAFHKPLPKDSRIGTTSHHGFYKYHKARLVQKEVVAFLRLSFHARSKKSFRPVVD